MPSHPFGSSVYKNSLKMLQLKKYFKNNSHFSWLLKDTASEVRKWIKCLCIKGIKNVKISTDSNISGK